jgi:hypothetical protein
MPPGDDLIHIMHDDAAMASSALDVALWVLGQWAGCKRPKRVVVDDGDPPQQNVARRGGGISATKGFGVFLGLTG